MQALAANCPAQQASPTPRSSPLASSSDYPDLIEDHQATSLAFALRTTGLLPFMESISVVSYDTAHGQLQKQQRRHRACKTADRDAVSAST